MVRKEYKALVKQVQDKPTDEIPQPLVQASKMPKALHGSKQPDFELNEQQSQSFFDPLHAKQPPGLKKRKIKQDRDIFLTAGEEGNPLDNESGFYSLSQDRETTGQALAHQSRTAEAKRKIAEEKFRKILQDKKEQKKRKER